jgi:hypothetical protein
MLSGFVYMADLEVHFWIVILYSYHLLLHFENALVYHSNDIIWLCLHGRFGSAFFDCVFALYYLLLYIENALVNHSNCINWLCIHGQFGSALLDCVFGLYYLVLYIENALVYYSNDMFTQLIWKCIFGLHICTILSSLIH